VIGRLSVGQRSDPEQDPELAAEIIVRISLSHAACSRNKKPTDGNYMKAIKFADASTMH